MAALRTSSVGQIRAIKMGLEKELVAAIAPDGTTLVRPTLLVAAAPASDLEGAYALEA